MAKKNKNIKEIKSIKNKLLNGELIKNEDVLYINNPNYFLTFSDLEISDGIDIIENIMVLSDDYISFNRQNEDETLTDVELMEITEEYKENKAIDGGYICQSFDKIDYIINSYNDITVITVISNDLEVQEFFNELKVVNSWKGFNNAKVDFGQIILLNHAFSPKLLIQLYKTAIKQKTKFFESLHLPIHINNILNNEDFLVIASNLPEETLNQDYIMEIGLDITNMEYEDDNIDLDEFIERIEDAVVISCEDALEKINLKMGILDYLVSKGILIGDLIEVGTSLLEDVEASDELKEKLENQLLKSISDRNINALLMGAIRMEEDIQKGRVREISLNEKLIHFYPDELIGATIANQIAGTKAILNFRRYSKNKPGILYGLGPILSNTFAGLIAGSITKTLEE
ncbi:phosphatidylglycerophosphatase A family protein [Methanobrevibacter olleyae]|uniref:Alpha-ribazole phosphatase CobZ n=1 Tax=Methanobrevibacter olleyae TaxID=294671 RepID=A0A126R1Q5_METOL|nr:phosphatidylglycerophosphatase [Methanobrevibacter olleyae]AMK15899.1 alpha-ribazole phosphatase CobZ [Methanobrevibacter olleyae]SFL14970.1 alpha-ribazole phosphatase CobZ [Methanobrevibacter olleyae]